MIYGDMLSLRLLRNSVPKKGNPQLHSKTLACATLRSHLSNRWALVSTYMYTFLSVQYIKYVSKQASIYYTGQLHMITE